MNLDSVKEAFMSRNVLWTIFCVFALIMLCVVLIYKFALPKSVCFCKPDQTIGELLLDGGEGTLYLIKLKDYGGCNQLCVDYDRVWVGVERDYNVFMDSVRNGSFNKNDYLIGGLNWT